MKSWENLLGIWHFRALPPVNSQERCQLWQCLDLSGGTSFSNRAGRSAHGLDLSLLLVCWLRAQGSPSSPAQGSLKFQLTAHISQVCTWVWRCTVGMGCRGQSQVLQVLHLTWLWFLKWAERSWGLHMSIGTGVKQHTVNKVPQTANDHVAVDLASSCHRFVI